MVLYDQNKPFSIQSQFSSTSISQSANKCFSMWYAKNKQIHFLYILMEKQHSVVKMIFEIGVKIGHDIKQTFHQTNYIIMIKL